MKTVVSSAQGGASMYQAMSIVLACFSQLWECVNPVFPQIAMLFQDILPLNVTPLAHSVLLQLLISALYSELLKQAQQSKSVKFPSDNAEGKSETNLVANGYQKQSSTLNVEKDVLEHKNSITSFDAAASNSEESVVLALAEALCSIDEDNKHTEQIEQFLDDVRENLRGLSAQAKHAEQSFHTLEIIASDLLSTSYGKRSLKVN